MSIMLMIFFCIWNLSNLLFTSIDVDVVKVRCGVVMMNDEMELMSGDVVMVGEGGVSGVSMNGVPGDEKLIDCTSECEVHSLDYIMSRNIIMSRIINTS